MTHYIQKKMTLLGKKLSHYPDLREFCTGNSQSYSLKISEFWVKCRLFFFISFFIKPFIYLTEERKQSTGKFKYFKQVFKK